MMVLQARLSWLDLNGEPVRLFGVTHSTPAIRGETRHDRSVTWLLCGMIRIRKMVPGP